MIRRKPILILLTALVLPGAVLIAARAGAESRDSSPKEPNLLVDVSATLVHAAVKNSVDRTEPVQEVIQETPICGMGRTLATVGAELIPDPSRAALDVVMRGQVCSLTVGTRPHVLVYAATATPLEIRQRIVIDGNGIQSLSGPLCADSTTHLLDIQSRREPDNLAIRFARKGFEQSKDAAETESARKTAWRASKRLADELAPPLASASQSVGRGLKEMKRIGLSLDFLDFRTTTGVLQVRLRIAIPGQAEPGPAPSLPEDIDLGVRVHQSVINQVAQAELGGKSFPLTELQKFYDEATHGLLRDGRTDGEQKDGLKNLAKLVGSLTGKPPAVTLARKDPLTVAFTEQGFTVEIRVASVGEDGMAYAGMRVRATYRLENSTAGAHAVRQGPVQFLPPPGPAPGEKKLDPQPLTFFLFREVVFAEILKGHLTLATLPVPYTLSSVRFSAPRAGSRNGWLALAWKLATPTTEMR